MERFQKIISLSFSLTLLLTSPSKAQNAASIYDTYIQLKDASKLNNISEPLKHLNKKLNLSPKDKSYISRLLTLKKPDPTLLVGLKGETIIWKQNKKEIQIDLSQIHESSISINGTKILLSINIEDSAESTIKKNTKIIKSALTQAAISKLSITEKLLSIILLPFASLTACATPESNDAALLGLAGWTEVKTTQNPNYLYAQKNR